MRQGLGRSSQNLRRFFCFQAAVLLLFCHHSHFFREKACRARFETEYFDIGSFKMMACYRLKVPSDRIRIYIEGDGRAWEGKSRLSCDPTPKDPVALELALLDTSESVVYLARPGQFSLSGVPDCDPAYWAGRRFAPEVVEALDRIIDLLKERAGSRGVEMVGYSGGGALAVLIAARRTDVLALRTVAGNLDPRTLHSYHNVSQLTGSMDPMVAASKVAKIPQRHFVGSKDRVVPAVIAENFIKMAGGAGDGWTTVVRASHHDGWCDHWNELLSLPLKKIE